MEKSLSLQTLSDIFESLTSFQFKMKIQRTTSKVERPESKHSKTAELVLLQFDVTSFSSIRNSDQTVFQYVCSICAIYRMAEMRHVRERVSELNAISFVVSTPHSRMHSVFCVPVKNVASSRGFVERFNMVQIVPLPLLQVCPCELSIDAISLCCM